MYIWMILATFIAMLAAFNLSPRTDHSAQQQMPLAEASITKFLVQHKAAVEYIRKSILDNHDGTKVLTAGQITGCNSEGVGDMCDFLPYGFKYEENAYYSKLYCLNPPEYQEGSSMSHLIVTKVQGTSVGSCSDPEFGVRYVITYGRVPERWKNVSTNRILGDYYKALRRRLPAGVSCGLIVPRRVVGDATDPRSSADPTNPLNSEYVIDGVDVQNISIPKYFLDNDSEYKSKCTPDIGGKFPCLIFWTIV